MGHEIRELNRVVEMSRGANDFVALARTMMLRAKDRDPQLMAWVPDSPPRVKALLANRAFPQIMKSDVAPTSRDDLGDYSAISTQFQEVARYSVRPSALPVTAVLSQCRRGRKLESGSRRPIQQRQW